LYPTTDFGHRWSLFRNTMRGSHPRKFIRPPDRLFPGDAPHPIKIGRARWLKSMREERQHGGPVIISKKRRSDRVQHTLQNLRKSSQEIEKPWVRSLPFTLRYSLSDQLFLIVESTIRKKEAGHLM